MPSSFRHGCELEDKRCFEGVRAGRYVRIGPEESEAMYFASVLTVPVVLRILEESRGSLDL